MFASDTLPFLRAWMRAPLRVAAIAPSGDALARLITSEIVPKDGPVLELGPGTGAFTPALLARGCAEHDLTLVELGADFANLLAMRYPLARILPIDASSLGASGLVAAKSHAAAVSGLPLLSMPAAKVAAILEATFAALKDGGALYQFTYGWRCPVSPAVLDSLGLEAMRIGFTWANLPPASVYRICAQTP